MKVVILTNIPNHYRIPLFNELYQLLSQNQIQLTVIFGAESYAARKNENDLAQCKFPYHILAAHKGRSGAIHYEGLISCLRNIDPDKIVVSGFNLGSLKSIVYAKRFRKPLILWTGSVDIGVVQSTPLMRLYRRLLLPFFDSYLTYGTAAKDYLVKLGAQESKVSPVGNTVDVVRLSEQIENTKPECSNKVIRMLYVGYLSERKNVRLLMPIVKRLSKEEKSFILDIVGDGDSKQSLEHEVSKLGLEQFVTFHGFKQREELPQYFAQADVFLFQTDGDIWGLVLNEAMSATLPVLASEHAAATHDLIKEGENGFVVNFRNIDSVCEKINWLFNHPTEAKQMGKMAKDTILENYSISAVAKRFYQGITE